MNTPVKTIAIIDFSDRHFNMLKSVLSAEDYHVIILKPSETDTIRENNEISLVLLHTGLMRSSDPFVLETIARLKMRATPEMVLISSLTEPEDFILGLESGIYHFINTPCRKKYLLDRIEEITGSSGTKDEGTPFLFRFKYKGKAYSIEIPQYRLAAALLSTMENSLHQNRLLITSLKKGLTTHFRENQEPLAYGRERFTAEEKKLEQGFIPPWKG
jgi:DNA-binding response OmpR family regulator